MVDSSKFYFVYFLPILSDQWWPTFQMQNGLGGRQPRAREESFKYEVGLTLITWKNLEMRILSVQIF